ncbi:hypothetical protein CROQUDRAFT_684468 [Cronartium quercuum f. sp. fusiforme G11]|uniref:Uncharacterized protein n=1 Tax=Cronartium quercuum f. sp. fusiforme G11 TaxID=708437 RepID=A0A9P6N885_9BASI|nr:hypothetical protein CROQUDRAFT_684468 [Cronartium quercuum f. sp. fusiforme G11]
MLRLFYLYLVININLRVNCVFVVTQAGDAIKNSQKYSEKPRETGDLLGVVASAKTDNLDPQPPTVKESPIVDPVTPVDGDAETSNPNHKSRHGWPANPAKNGSPRNDNARTRKTKQKSGRGRPAKVAKTKEVSAISFHLDLNNPSAPRSFAVPDQLTVAQVLDRQDIFSLQTKSFETLASILQHQHYAMSWDKIIARSSLSWWILSNAERPSKIEKQITTIGMNNFYFRLYQCIHGHAPHQKIQQFLLASITLAMVETFCKPQDFNYLLTQQHLLLWLARQQKAVPVAKIPNAKRNHYTRRTV